MANTVDITSFMTGNHRAIFHVALKSDGETGELSDEVIIDPVADLGLPSTTRLNIECIDYSLNDFAVNVEFNSGLVAKNLAWVLTPDGHRIDFVQFSAIKDPSGVDGDGKIQLVTHGFTATSAVGTIVIKIRYS